MLRHSFYRGSFWAVAVVLPIGLGWWVLDRLLPGAGVRLVDRLRL
jgi:hypothetical protein